MVEDIQAMLMEDIIWAKKGHHVEEGELVLVNQCRGRERARQEVEGWGWSPRMEALESLQSQPSMDREYSHLRWGEQEGGQATEQLWGRVAGLHPQTGCRVSPVTPGHATRDDRVE